MFACRLSRQALFDTKSSETQLSLLRKSPVRTRDSSAFDEIPPSPEARSGYLFLSSGCNCMGSAKRVVASFGAARRIVQDKQRLHIYAPLVIVNQACVPPQRGRVSVHRVHSHSLGRCRVSRMRTAARSPEANVSPPMTQTAAFRPRASAVTPAMMAPIAYPKSRQRR